MTLGMRLAFCRHERRVDFRVRANAPATVSACYVENTGGHRHEQAAARRRRRLRRQEAGGRLLQHGPDLHPSVVAARELRDLPVTDGRAAAIRGACLVAALTAVLAAASSAS